MRSDSAPVVLMLAGNTGEGKVGLVSVTVGANGGVNGLPILAVEPGLDRYYRDYVIGGPGAFMVPAESYDTFADAILKKLITEIAARAPTRSGG